MKQQNYIAPIGILLAVILIVVGCLGHFGFIERDGKVTESSYVISQETRFEVTESVSSALPAETEWPSETDADTTPIETELPDETIPETKEPETTKPETTLPETTKPQTAKPETTRIKKTNRVNRQRRVFRRRSLCFFSSDIFFIVLSYLCKIALYPRPRTVTISKSSLLRKRSRTRLICTSTVRSSLSLSISQISSMS